jgi:transglutaminase-like putative cysteine protease
MLEIAASLIRDAGILRNDSWLSGNALLERFPDDPSGDLFTNQFAVARVWTEGIQIQPPYTILWGIPVEWEPIIFRAQSYWHVYLPVQSVSVFTGRNRTGTVFRPLASRQIWFDESGPDYYDRLIASPGGDLRTPGFMARGTIYFHRFLHVNPELSFVRDILQGSQPGLYASRESIDALSRRVSVSPVRAMDDLFSGFAHHGVGTPRITLEFNDKEDLLSTVDSFSAHALAAYAESVRAHFMLVPDTVPQRVHDLTREIIRGEQTDFGRVMAIRDYLLTHYTYTLSPSPVPRGVCFVDYFLFEGREGYCTYFASAMAILSRIAGVPSRYVEGYFIPGEGRHEYSLAAVTNRMAHAWAEVYLEGFGWLTVEATPPYAFAAAQTSSQGPRRAPGTEIQVWDDYTLYMDDWWMHYMQQNEGGATGGLPPASAGQETEETGFSFRHVVWLIGGIVLALGAGALLFLIVCRIRFSFALKRIKTLPPNHQTMIYFKGILNISEYYNLPMHAGETTVAYGKRAGKRFAFRSDAVFLSDLIDLYNRAKFGYRQISAAELSLMRDAYFAMLALLREMRAKPHFWYLRYIKHVGSV